MRIFIAVALIVGLVSLVIAIVGSLGRPATTVSQPAAPAAAVEPTAAPTAAPAAAVELPAGAPVLEIGAAAVALNFDKNALEAPANTVIGVKFTNQNDLGVQHNWVLVNGGEDVASVVNDSAATNAPSFLPTDMADVIANSQLLNVGQEETVVFTTPGPGTYTFICTFPGHYLAGMKGTFTVK